MPEEILEKDREFYQSLRDYLSQFSEGLESTVPVFFNTDGTIERRKTLDSPCFQNYILEVIEGQEALHR